MVGQLRDVKEVRGQAAHQLARAVAVKVAEAQILHVPEQVLADVRLHPDAEGVAPVGDDIVEERPQGKRGEHDDHDGEKHPIVLLRQQIIHGHAGDEGKGQVDQRNEKGAEHIHKEQLAVGLEIVEKNLENGLLLEFPGGHNHVAPYFCRCKVYCITAPPSTQERPPFFRANSRLSAFQHLQPRKKVLHCMGAKPREEAEL